MLNQNAVNVECYGDFQRVPFPNQYVKINKLKNIICDRFHIEYPFNLTYEGAQLCDQDILHDLALNPNQPIRVRRCSVDAYVTDSMIDIFLSYERTYREIVRQLKQKLEEKNYSCLLDVDETSGNDQFSPAVEQGIQNSTVFVCCITSKYVGSNKCRQELSFYKPIILLLMEDLNWPPQQIGTVVYGLSYIEFYNTALSGSSTSWPPEKFDELLSRLADLNPHM